MKKLLSLAMAIIVVCSFVFMALGSGSDDSASSSDGTTSAVAAAEQKVEGKIGNYICKIKSAEICKSWDGKDSVKIIYEFTNNGEEAESFDIALNDDVYQDGVGLETSFISGDDDFGIDVKIKPGTTKEVAKVYKLNDTATALEVEISEFISLSDEKLTYTVELS